MQPPNSTGKAHGLEHDAQSKDETTPQGEAGTTVGEAPTLEPRRPSESSNAKGHTTQQAGPGGAASTDQPGNPSTPDQPRRPPTSDQPRHDSSRRSRLESLLSVSTFLLAVATFGLWLSTCSADHHAEIAANAAIRAANAANKIASQSLEASRAQLLPTLRPIITPPAQFGVGGTLALSFVNNGSLDVQGILRLAVRPLGQNEPTKFEEWLAAQEPGSFAVPRQQIQTVSLYEDDTNSTDIKYNKVIHGLPATSTDLVVFGVFTYTNELGGSKTVQFCNLYFLDAIHKVGHGGECKPWNKVIINSSGQTPQVSDNSAEENPDPNRVTH